MSRLLILAKTILIVAAICLLGSCSKKEDVQDLPKGTPVTYENANATTHLNLRSGPGTRYPVVSSLFPKEQVRILERSGDSWARVAKEDGTEGYASLKYLNNIYPMVMYVEESEPTYMYDSDDPDFYVDYYEQPSPRGFFGSCAYHCSNYVRWLTELGSKAWIIIAALFAAEALILWWSYKKYNYRRFLPSPRLPSIWPGYTVISIFTLLTIAQLVGIFAERPGASLRDAWYACLILSTGLVPAVIPWRIHTSGNLIYSDKNPTSRSFWGRVIGLFTWLPVLIPLSIFALGVHSYMSLELSDTNDLAIVLMFVGGYAVAFFCVFWTWSRIIQYLLVSLNNILLEIFSFVLLLSAYFIGMHMCWDLFKFINYLLGIFAISMVSLFFSLHLLNSIATTRCPNCHMCSGFNIGTTDHGNKYSTDCSWITGADNDPTIPCTRSGSNIRDVQSLVRTTYSEHTWTDHQECAYCNHDWDVNYSSGKRAIDHQTLRKEWTEEYYD